MIRPRITAIVFVFLLIGVLSLACIGPVAFYGPSLFYGRNLDHVDGRIVAIEPDMSFVLQTANGKSMHFRCDGQCRLQFGHMQRHELEKAHTDVYYLEMAGNLLALDVD
jgi:hypothetical protein